MRATVVALGLCTCIASFNARAEFSIAGGGEYFRWQEATSPTVKETGMRLSADLSWVSSKEPGWSLGANVKFYTGSVDYDGNTLFGNVPFTGTTDYDGINPELRVFHRVAGNPLSFMAALGIDHWDRKLSSVQVETYQILYVRLGGEYNTTTTRGVFGGAGIKYPIQTRENAHLQDIGFTENPRLEPGRGPSFYATLGYRFTPNWDVLGYYDSFRFKASRLGDAGGGFAVFQPRSDMDVVGVKLQHNF